MKICAIFNTKLIENNIIKELFLNIQTIQIYSKNNELQIVVVISDKDKASNEHLIDNSIKIIHGNLNYEYGAYKIGYNLYPNYNVYVCLQDNYVLCHQNNEEINNKPLCVKPNLPPDLHILNDNTIYSVPERNGSGFTSMKNSRELCKQLYKNTVIENSPDKFQLALHNSFILTNKILQELIETLNFLPKNKIESMLCERIFGLYFIEKKIKCLNLQEYGRKISKKRQ